MRPVAPAQAGMLAIFHDIAAGHEAAVRDWYAREHHFERLAIPGFLEARRFDRESGEAAQVLGLYRLAGPQVLDSPAYHAALAAPSERTRATMPNFRSMCRTVCSIAASAGQAEGGSLAALAVADGSLEDPGAACERLLALSGVLRVEAIVAASAAPATPASTAEAALRGGPDARIAWALLVDADSAAAAQAALEAARTYARPSRIAQAGVYRLAFAARNPR
jgi:hypothetical protein